MGNKKICQNCGKEFDPADTRENNQCGPAYHPQQAEEIGESGSSQYDYSTVYKYPCCGQVEFPQWAENKPAPGCVFDVHVAME